MLFLFKISFYLISYPTHHRCIWHLCIESKGRRLTGAAALWDVNGSQSTTSRTHWCLVQRGFKVPGDQVLFFIIACLPHTVHSKAPVFDKANSLLWRLMISLLVKTLASNMMEPLKCHHRHHWHKCPAFNLKRANHLSNLKLSNPTTSQL